MSISRMKKNILVTGSTGFIGSNLLRRLVGTSADIHIITRKSSNLWRIQDVINNVKKYHIDLTNYDEVNAVVHEIEPDIIYHLATYGGNPRQDEFMKIFKSNFFGTVNLINSCKKMGFDLFVNTGSSSEYGIKSSPMKESDVTEPRNYYGLSKISSTLFCQSVALNEKIPIVTLRLFSPYGDFEDSSRLIPSVILSCLNGKDPQISSCDFVRDFIYIDDVIDVYMQISILDKIPNTIFNVGYGKQHTVGEIVDNIINIIGNPVCPKIGLPKRWINEPQFWQADISKISELLNWKPRYNLISGLTKTVAWFREHHYMYS